jgi:hypothetical protein
MPATSPLLALPYLQPNQAQKHVTHNEALQILDAVVQLRVKQFALATPPDAPSAGDVLEVGPGATGAWAGQTGRLALWDGTGWQFLQPRDGWRAWDQTGRVLRVYGAGAWGLAHASLQDLDGLGIGMASNSANRLAVAAEGSLLTHRGAGHQLRVNKAGAGDTASLLFQSNWTGHAEIGLAGGLDLSVKVSDGTTWTSALAIARATGVVTLPQGAVVNGTVTGTAVQASPLDATAGRLLTVGAFGLGGPLPAIANAGATDGNIVPGLYAYDTAAGSTGGPASVTRGTLLHSRRGAALGETQALVVESGSASGVYAGLVFGRSRSGGGWSAWSCGSVQDSSTGANGRCLRQQDGTQTCWHTITTSATAETVWTYPQAFASASGLVVTMGVNSSALTALMPRHTAKGASSVSLSVVNASGARVAATLDLMAVGRWY